MSHIPVDLDTTMWDIAERGDAQAAKDFSERFPALSSDMQTRMNLVGGMKGMRNAIAPAFVPTFMPKFMSKPKPKWLRYGPAALTLAALAAASFYVTQNLLTPLPDPSVFRPAPAAGSDDQREVSLPAAVPPAPSPEAGPKPYRPEGHNNDDLPAVPVRVQMSHVHLINAIQALGRRFHATVTVPKDFANPIVDVDITGTDLMSFMNQLANANKFTAYYEGDNKVLIVPAEDENKSPSSGD